MPPKKSLKKSENKNWKNPKPISKLNKNPPILAPLFPNSTVISTKNKKKLKKYMLVISNKKTNTMETKTKKFWSTSPNPKDPWKNTKANTDSPNTTISPNFTSTLYCQYLPKKISKNSRIWPLNCSNNFLILLKKSKNLEDIKFPTTKKLKNPLNSEQICTPILIINYCFYNLITSIWDTWLNRV